MLKGQSESDLLPGLNQEPEASRETAGKGLRHEEDANCVANYVSEQNYHTSPNTSRSSKETAETVHKRYQKGAEESAVLNSVGSMTSTVCVPVWLPFCSDYYASNIRLCSIQSNWDVYKLFYRLMT